MKIEFIKSALAPDQFPRHSLPEVALAGRSNVGKSSLVNCLAGRKGLARVSKRPGCTRMLNFFSIAGKACLVDLPGYGFAKVSRGERERWSDSVNAYLEERDNLTGIVVVMDANVPPTPLDLDMIAYSGTLGVPVLPVATKIDRIARTRRDAALHGFARDLGNRGGPVLPFSANTGAGRRDLLAWIATACGVGRIA